MSVSVTLEISEDEAFWLRSVGEWNTTCGARVLSKVAAAMPPREFRVGDIVRWGSCTYPVLAVWRKWAWVGDDEAGPYDAPLDQLILVEPALAAAVEGETP